MRWSSLSVTSLGVLHFPLDFQHLKQCPDLADNSLSIGTPIPPNIPLPLPVQSLLLPPLSNLLCDQSLVLAIIPFRQVICDFDYFIIITTLIHNINCAIIEENFESLDCTLTRGDENADELGSVKKFSGAYE